MARSLGLVLDLAFAGFVSVTDVEGNPIVRHGRPPGARYDDIAEWIEGALTEVEGNFSDLAWICVGIGPGSFTGIRIAMAFAQGLAMPREVPLHGFTSFVPLLLSTPEREMGDTSSEAPQLAILPANTGLFYAASHLEDPGALLSAEEVRGLASSQTVLKVPALTASLDPILPYFHHTHAVEEGWNVPAVVTHARTFKKTFKRDALHPYYLQLSAAEAKLSDSV